MNPIPHVVIVLARCSQNRQGFGIRFEEKAASRWSADWAFAIKETTARKEGYDRAEIRGAFGSDPAYPGCPHCGARGIFKCNCGKVACWDGERRVVTCPWCGSTGGLSGHVESLRAGNDR
jgi:hypothetical protein